MRTCILKLRTHRISEYYILCLHCIIIFINSRSARVIPSHISRHFLQAKRAVSSSRAPFPARKNERRRQQNTFRFLEKRCVFSPPREREKESSYHTALSIRSLAVVFLYSSFRPCAQVVKNIYTASKLGSLKAQSSGRLFTPFRLSKLAPASRSANNKVSRRGSIYMSSHARKRERN